MEKLGKVLKLLNGKNEISRLHRGYWYKIADEYEWYEFYLLLCKELKFEPYTFEQFDYCWQYRLLNHENYKQAKIEFANLVAGFC
jgi:hypothetical protein